MQDPGQDEKKEVKEGADAIAAQRTCRSLMALLMSASAARILSNSAFLVTLRL